MNESEKLAAWCIFAALMLGVSAWFTLSLWDECRAVHSVMFCLNVLG